MICTYLMNFNMNLSQNIVLNCTYKNAKYSSSGIVFQKSKNAFFFITLTFEKVQCNCIWRDHCIMFHYIEYWKKKFTERKKQLHFFLWWYSNPSAHWKSERFFVSTEIVFYGRMLRIQSNRHGSNFTHVLKIT